MSKTNPTKDSSPSRWWAVGATFVSVFVLAVGASKYTSVRVPRSAKPSLVTTTVQVPELSQSVDRITLFQSWIHGAETLATRSGDEEALRVMDYIQKNAVVCAPQVEGISCLRPQGSGLAFIVTLPGDERISNLWAGLLQRQQVAAFYRHREHAIVLKNQDSLSPLTKGQLVLHEARHALSFSMGLVDPSDPVSVATDEVHTREFVYRVLQRFGGSPYEDTVNNYVDLITSSNGPVEVIFNYDERLELAFGPASSLYDKQIRAAEAWCHASFVKYERLYGPSAAILYKQNMMRVMPGMLDAIAGKDKGKKGA